MKQQPSKPDYQFKVATDAGEFTFQPLTIGQKIKLRPIVRALYGGPLPADGSDETTSMELNAAWIIAEMQQACVEQPEDWTWEAAYSFDPIFDLWKEYSAKRDTFRKEKGID